jgi:tRNA A22 N-methylase
VRFSKIDLRMFKLSGPHGLTTETSSASGSNEQDRLSLVQRCIPERRPHLDLATGHAQLLASLATEEPARALCGTDKSRAEVESAEEYLNRAIPDHRIRLIHTSDVPPPAQWGAMESFSLSATGLGGANMAELLVRNSDHLERCDHMVLQPNRDEAKVRAVLPRLGFSVDRERFVIDRDYLYLVIVCTPISTGTPPLLQREIVHGRWSEQPRQPTELQSYFAWHLRSLDRKVRGELAGHNWEDAEEAYRAYRAFENIHFTIFGS